MIDEKGLEAAARAFKRMHGDVCYPQASNGEAKWAATEIITAYLSARSAEPEHVVDMQGQQSNWAASARKTMSHSRDHVIEALASRAAIKARESARRAEPVAWAVQLPGPGAAIRFETDTDRYSDPANRYSGDWRPLFAHPTQEASDV